jgi:[protein-PII] uridylyltransferase
MTTANSLTRLGEAEHELARAAVIADSELVGAELCRALSLQTDEWLRALLVAAKEQVSRPPKVALLAVGGYGRGELSPFSDLDVLLVHESTAARVEELAAAIWYPLWNAGLKVGHAVRTVDEQQSLSRNDLDTATALLTARYVAGDQKLATSVVEMGAANWHKKRKKWLAELQGRVRQRQIEAGEVAYTLEPDLKNGHGGLRDAQSLWWAAAAGLSLPVEDQVSLLESYHKLLTVRVALHRAVLRPGETLRLEDQDAVAVQAGLCDADALMADVAAAARTIAWIADEAWGRVGRSIKGSVERIAPGVELVDGEVELANGADPVADPTLVLKAAVAAARRRTRIGRRSLDLLSEQVPPWPDIWPVGATDELVALLLEGHDAIPVLEALDQRGLFSRLLPEWEPVRSRPQRNAYHRFTVDRHLWEAAANAADLAEQVGRPDLLVMGALFHDLGKGYPGDHTEVGMVLVREIAPRLGFTPPEVEILVAMVEHHLLLPDVAVRRDLSDDATISFVADKVQSREVLELLHALTEADSKATGPSAWNSWKEELVRDLVARTRHLLDGGDVAEVTWRLFPDEATLAKMAEGGVDIIQGDDRITIVYPDRPGAFSQLAGVLSLHGLDVLSSRAHSEEAHGGAPAMAASQFRVVSPRQGWSWESVRADLQRALDGELAIEARLAERAQTYRRRRATQAAPPASPQVEFHDWASSNSTVIEVRAPTKIGILYRITKALAEMGLDIRHATVQTIGVDVVDTFYVRTRTGELVTEAFHRAEIQRAILHAVGDFAVR